MPNIATILKEEITRLARKELRGENAALRKASAQYRSDIARLKRSVQELERQLVRISKGIAPKPTLLPEDAVTVAKRFGAKGFAAQRQRLGLSAAELGVLLNCSGQSVYKWEQGKARPRAGHMPAILALGKLSKAQAVEALATL
jgi:DNA-binding transcriptional regulator YiaG